jgi:hypothetical protein
MEGVTNAVTINVGGTLFHTTADTLNKSPYFEAMLRGLPKSEHPQVPFIDRDARAFHHVLSLLRNPSYNFPTKFQHELLFFGLDHEASISVGSYLLPDDLMHLPWAERAKRGPVQLVPIHQALKITHITYAGASDLRAFKASFTWELFQKLKECATCEFLGNEMDVTFVCNKQTEIFVQTTESRFKPVAFDEFFTYLQKSTYGARAVPVLSSLSTHPYEVYCYALLVVTAFGLHRFQGLPRGCTLD